MSNEADHAAFPVERGLEGGFELQLPKNTEPDAASPERGVGQQVCFECCGCGLACISDCICTCPACGGRGCCPRR